MEKLSWDIFLIAAFKKLKVLSLKRKNPSDKKEIICMIIHINVYCYVFYQTARLVSLLFAQHGYCSLFIK